MSETSGLLTEELSIKYEQLKQYIQGLGSVAVAFSGGVDSTFLLKTAHEVLGEHAIALTVKASFVPDRELQEAKAFCKEEGIRHLIAEVDASEIEGFAQNPKNRCYFCKKALFQNMLTIAKEYQIADVVEGSNVDDLGDYRPGLMAIAELGIKSPLKEVGLTKEEIRILSKKEGLRTWDKPSYACLASRFVYGETITPEKLAMVEMAEQLLIEMGFVQMRVRVHGTMARIEVLPEDMERFLAPEIREEVCAKLKAYGFSYVTLDLMGYRMGSMNEVLNG